MTLLQEQPALKKTPLYDSHVRLGAKMTDFAGWSMPVYYSGIIAEHQWVRGSCGAFDVSHLGELRVQGPGAEAFLQQRLTNDLRKLGDRQIQYHLLCNEHGYTLDDVLVYRESADDFYIIVNASNIATDEAAFRKQLPSGVILENHSDETACVAVQGPRAQSALRELFGWDLSAMKYYTFGEYRWNDITVWISRSGYTGEDGFELFVRTPQAETVWEQVVQVGRSHGILPAGLGARNTLRLEAGNVLYGHELTSRTTPLDAGLAWAVSFDKPDFVGRAALLAQKERGLARKLVGFMMSDRTIARDAYPVLIDGKHVGEVASGSFAPTVNRSIGMAYIDSRYSEVGQKIQIEVHGRLADAEIVKRPFIELKHKNKRGK